MNIFKQDQEGRDVVQDIIVSVGFWLLVVLFFFFVKLLTPEP